MPSTSDTAVNTRGYAFHLPSLGLPDPAGEWVQLRGAYGSKDACISLLKSSSATTVAPLQHVSNQRTVFEIEHAGAVWIFEAPGPSQANPRSQLFSINVQRLRAASAPPSNRTKLPNDIDWIFVNAQAQEVEYGSFDRSEEMLLDLHRTLGGRFSMAGLRIFTNCINPTPSQAEPILPRAHSFDDVEARKRESQNEAKVVWQMMSSSYLNKNWLRKLHDDAIAAGLRQPTDVFDPSKPIAMYRVHEEDDFDNVRSLDYALCNMEGTYPHPLQATWLPLPDDAADPVWVRCGINLFRFNLGRRLFSKAEWPPHAAS